jgi:UDP-N-acetylmuramate dehydrogenase
MDIEENRLLAPLTTLGIGGPARWFVEVKNEDDILEAVRFSRDQRLPLFVLGGGSNLLVSDQGFPGLVLRIGLEGIKQDGDIFRVSAGENWDRFVSRAVERNYAGIECLAGIPGTAGGTPVQNVGAYGEQVAETIVCVRALDLTKLEFVELPPADCGFSYRSSIFNSTSRGRYIITRVDYLLQENGPPNLLYPDLKLYFQDRTQPPSLTEVTAATRQIRRSKGMLLVEGDTDRHSAGSFFKNPTVSEAQSDPIIRFAEQAGVPLRLYPVREGLVKVPAAWLIEQAGFSKGYAVGAVSISSRHTLALVNRGGATAQEMLDLAERISSTVQSRFGIHLEMEPVPVGFP